jgi:YYY domain-containing protein
MFNSQQPFYQRRTFFYGLLALVILLGGYFRFVGLNWDDFVGSHPDERFLTVNLLPLVGGNLEFTDDSTNFMKQGLYISGGSSVISPENFRNNPNALLGVLENSVGAEFAPLWIDAARIRSYPTPETMQEALLNNQIQGFFLQADMQIPASINFPGMAIFQLYKFSSEEIQQAHCRARFPDTGGIGGFFDARCSNYNPHNSGAGFYAYGTLPLFIARASLDVLTYLQGQNPTMFPYVGTVLPWRFWSAIFDIGSILFLYFIGARLHNRWTGLFAALIYACAPLVIQKAHFGTVNAITAFFVVLAFWAAAGVQDRGRYFYYAVFGIAFGAAVAGRINILPLIGVLGVAMIINTAAMWDTKVVASERTRILTHALIGLIITLICTFLVFRVTNPYAFVGPGFFGLSINDRFLNDLSSARFGISGASDAPPNYQWVGRASYFYPLRDIVLWGMGIASAGMMLYGVFWGLWRLIRRYPNSTRNAFLLAWILFYFFYMGNQWVMTMRYYLPLYSAMALISAWALTELWQMARQRPMNVSRLLLGIFGAVLGTIPVFYALNNLPQTTTSLFCTALSGILIGSALFLKALPRVAVLATFTLGFTILWGFMFTNIYRNQLTRVEASHWLWENIPGDFAMRIEGAPEGTPLINIALGNASGGSETYTEVQTAGSSFFPDTPFLQEFVAPATGTISEVIVPRIAEINADSEPETLYVSIAAENANGELALIGEKTLTDNFTRENSLVGNAYVVRFDTPIAVTEGQSYTFKAEAITESTGSGNFTAAAEFMTFGSVIVTEGTWDDRITTMMVCTLPEGISLLDNIPSGYMSFNDCNGRNSYVGLVTSYDAPMSYPIDDENKRDAIRNALHLGDYYVITSNRFYDSESRNDFRFPLTNRFYNALFAGELGFELIKTVNTSYEFAGLSVADQHIPTYNSPMWLNELEPDEAFHVYDHPVVFFFKKTADYDRVAVDRFFDSYSITRPETVSLSGDAPPIIGALYYDSLQYDAAPNGLMQAPDQRAINQTGGTWSERFDSSSPLYTDQTLGAAVWWLLIMGYGLAAFPVVFVMFPRMADRGYGVSKLVGLFVVAYLAWFFAGLKVPLWSQVGVLICLGALIIFSGVLVFAYRKAFFGFIRDHWKLLLTIECITLLLFLIMIGVRLSNPDLWHISKGGEKPMDFAYFNAVLRTTTFPAADPWFAGGNLNYYYWGFVLFGSPVLALKILPSFAYNLIIPTVFALSGIAAFCAAFNIVSAWNRPTEPNTTIPTQRYGNPYLAGIAAIMLCVVLGNLDTIRVFTNGVLTLGSYQFPSGMQDWILQQYPDPTDPNVIQIVSERVQQNNLSDRIAYEVQHRLGWVTSFFRGMGLLMSNPNVQLPIGTDRWYWAPSRIIDEDPSIRGNAIAEMPYFTFVYGDLHAHMLSFPVMLFVILFVYSELINAKRDERSFFVLVMSVVIGGAFVGMIQGINTWDYPAYTLFAVVGLGYAWWVRFEGFNRQSITFMLAYIGGFLIISQLANLPYRTWYAATYGSIQLWQQNRTPLWSYMHIWGTFLFLIISLLVWESQRWLSSVKVKVLKGKDVWVIFGFILLFFILLIAVVAAGASYQVALFVVPLVVWVAVLFFRPNQSPQMQFVLVIAGLALCLTLGVEVIVVAGDIGRQNTVFKFYLQAWMLFSVAAACAYAWLIRASEHWSLRLTGVWYTPLFILFFLAALFPVMATRGRSYDRQSFNVPLTLDGLDYMPYSSTSLFYTGGVSFSQAEDYQMIRWLQENVQGTPYIMEGREIASEYTWTARIAINTGLPSVLGWRFHQTQQRTFPNMTALIDNREQNINYFYSTSDIPQALNILRFFDVSYVIVGRLEMGRYPEGLAKFEQMVEQGYLTEVFTAGESRIYQVNREMLDPLKRN